MKTIHTISVDNEKLQEYIQSVESGHGEFVAGILIGQLIQNFKVVVEKKEVDLEEIK